MIPEEAPVSTSSVQGCRIEPQTMSLLSMSTEATSDDEAIEYCRAAVPVLERVNIVTAQNTFHV